MINEQLRSLLNDHIIKYFNEWTYALTDCVGFSQPHPFNDKLYRCEQQIDKPLTTVSKYRFKQEKPDNAPDNWQPTYIMTPINDLSKHNITNIEANPGSGKTHYILQ